MAVLLKLTLPIALALAFVSCSKEPEPTPVAEAAPALVVEDTRPVIAVFGDSISAGYGLDPGKTFPEALQRLVDASGHKYRVANMGVSGDTTTNAVERLPSVLSLKPKIVIVEFGGNDGLRGQPVKSSKANLATVIEGLQNAGAKVVLAGMSLPRNYGPEYIHDFEQMYTDLAKKYKTAHIPFILDRVAGVPGLMQQDEIHPTAKGAEIVARTTMNYLQPLLQ